MNSLYLIILPVLRTLYFLLFFNFLAAAFLHDRSAAEKRDAAPQAVTWSARSPPEKIDKIALF